MPAVEILMETIFSAVKLLIELTVVEGRALLETQRFCRDIPNIIPVED